MIPNDGSAATVSRDMSFRKLLGVIDVPGILLFAVGLIAFLVGLLSAKSSGHFSMWNIIVVLTGLVALGIFVRHELKTVSPFIPLRTFAKYPGMTWANIQYLLVNLLYYSLFLGFHHTCKWCGMSVNSRQGFLC